MLQHKMKKEFWSTPCGGGDLNQYTELFRQIGIGIGIGIGMIYLLSLAHTD